MAFLGIQLGQSLDSLVNEYIGNNVHPPATWPGSRADLLQKVSTLNDQCANWVHTKNWTINRANARTLCKQKIEDTAYKPLLDQLMTEEGNFDRAAKAAVLAGNGKLYAIIAIVLAVLITIVVILKLRR